MIGGGNAGRIKLSLCCCGVRGIDSLRVSDYWSRSWCVGMRWSDGGYGALGVSGNNYGWLGGENIMKIGVIMYVVRR